MRRSRRWNRASIRCWPTPVFLKEIDASLKGYALFAGEELEAAINATRAMSEDGKTRLQDFLTRAYGARLE